ncbi:MAG TPA: HAMP domain-containing sensor histidine kinase [Albitalea sp.]
MRIVPPPPVAPVSAQGFPLLRWFSAVSFFAVAVVSVVLALVLARFVEHQVLRHDGELSQQFVQGIVDTQGVASYFTEHSSSGRPAPFEEFFGHVASMPDVLRANVYGTDGTVLWSSNETLIGRQLGPNEELERALKGELVIERGEVSSKTAPKAEHLTLGTPAAHFVENYLPVYESGTRPGRQIGVVELYRVPHGLNATLRSGTFLVWASALVSGLVLYLSTLGLVRKASRLMNAQHEALVENQALALVGEISASVAHSIRNPLASIRSGAELQKELGQVPPDTAQETIGHVDRIEHLVRTLLTYARAPSDVQGSADVAQTLKLARERFAPVFAAQGKQLELRLTGPLPPVQGESVLITQVVNSLIANALEATGTGDRVVVSAARDGTTVHMEVCDTGPGIEPERLADVFKPFHTTKPHGLGMGLALVRRTIERLGGVIELQSRPGLTRAIVQLPVAEG